MLARFEAALNALSPVGKLGLAVSGGPDSMALLHLAHATVPARIEVGTVNHGLRREAGEECALVESVCRELGIPCAVLEVTVGEGNLQDRARAARYAVLGQWAVERGLAAVATAHHADDQAETLLMRLNRGSGLAGLAGIRSSTFVEGCPVPVVRPLLLFAKAELLAFVEAREIPFVEDPSNRDEGFERVRIRRQLGQAPWIEPRALSQSAAHLEEAEAALEAIATQHWDRSAVTAPGRIEVPKAGVLDTNSRLVARAIRLLGGAVSHGEVAAYLKIAGSRGNIAGILIDSTGDSYICTPEPARRSR